MGELPEVAVCGDLSLRVYCISGPSGPFLLLIMLLHFNNKKPPDLLEGFVEFRLQVPASYPAFLYERVNKYN